MQVFIKYPPVFGMSITQDDVLLADSEALVKMTTPCQDGVIWTNGNFNVSSVDGWPIYDRGFPSRPQKKWTIKGQGFAQHYMVSSSDDEQKLGTQK